jgi:hypothetical protein
MKIILAIDDDSTYNKIIDSISIIQTSYISLNIKTLFELREDILIEGKPDVIIYSKNSELSRVINNISNIVLAIEFNGRYRDLVKALKYLSKFKSAPIYGPHMLYPDNEADINLSVVVHPDSAKMSIDLFSYTDWNISRNILNIEALEEHVETSNPSIVLLDPLLSWFDSAVAILESKRIPYIFTYEPYFNLKRTLNRYLHSLDSDLLRTFNSDCESQLGILEPTEQFIPLVIFGRETCGYKDKNYFIKKDTLLNLWYNIREATNQIILVEDNFEIAKQIKII